MKKLLTVSFAMVLALGLVLSSCGEDGNFFGFDPGLNGSLFTISVSPGTIDEDPEAITITGVNINNNCDVFYNTDADCEDETNTTTIANTWTEENNTNITEAPDLGETGTIEFDYSPGAEDCVCFVVRCTTTFGTFWSNVVKRTVNVP